MLQADNNNLTQPPSTSVTININMPVSQIRSTTAVGHQVAVAHQVLR